MSPTHLTRTAVAAGLLLGAAPAAAPGQSRQIPAAPQPGPIVITGATVYPGG